jgi:hypothetical protein
LCVCQEDHLTREEVDLYQSLLLRGNDRLLNAVSEGDYDVEVRLCKPPGQYFELVCLIESFDEFSRNCPVEVDCESSCQEWIFSNFGIDIYGHRRLATISVGCIRVSKGQLVRSNIAPV